MKLLLLGAVGLVLTGCNQSTDVAETKAGETAAAVEAKVEAPPPKSEPKRITLPDGTRLRVRTTTTLSTKTADSGERFSGSLAEAVLVDGDVVVPKGANVEGVIAESDDGGRVKGVASISLRLTSLEVDGDQIPITSGLYVKEAAATKKKDAVKVGVGAGIGAAIGAIAGGGKGAAIGAASGAGAGTGVVLATHGDPAVVAAESIINFRLTAPVELTAR